MPGFSYVGTPSTFTGAFRSRVHHSLVLRKGVDIKKIWANPSPLLSQLFINLLLTIIFCQFGDQLELLARPGEGVHHPQQL